MKKKLLRLYDALYRHYGPQRWWPARTKFEVIVGTILTQNTSWKNVEKAISNLAREKFLLPRSIHNASNEKIASLIRPSGYYNIKAARLKNFTDFLFERYGGSLKRMFSHDMAELRSELLSIKGLGPETADSILLYAGGKPVFVVDTYTRRILSRHRLISAMDEYSKVQRLFMGSLPPDSRLFNEYHALLVRLAKEACNKDPKCAGCPVKTVFKSYSSC